ncbi:MAG: hypothetical protein IJT96_05155 [Lachnospiraceae bacterium]|nr:hypothetical protein [Lachnospiraceae bacterium]
MSYNREYKSSVFAMLYEDKENLLDLYNGVNGKSLANADDITVNTLTDKDGVESGIFMKVKNDVSFIFDSCLNLYEHQSTANRNIPLRMLLYVARLMYGMTSRRELYREKAIELPAPRFAVFYNGTADVPARVELKLSDQYEVKQDKPDLELKVTVYNINSDKGKEILDKSRTLHEYTEFTERMRRALEGMRTDEERREAMNKVIDQCVAEGILVKLLTERRDEIMETSIFQYDQEAHEWALYEDGYDEGIQQGMQQGIRQGMQQQELKDAETISGYQNQIATMQTEMAIKQTEMAAMQAEKATMQTKMAAMQAELEALRARVNA